MREGVDLGRSLDNDLTLSRDPLVSGHHARIVRRGSTFYLEDLGSRNGTYVGGHRVHERIPIGPGTLITVGQTQIEFMPD